jgi:hypothetical protein
MIRHANCFKIAVVQTSFQLLKRGRVKGNRQIREEAGRHVLDFIEMLSNPKRNMATMARIRRSGPKTVRFAARHSLGNWGRVVFV